MGDMMENSESPSVNTQSPNRTVQNGYHSEQAQSPDNTGDQSASMKQTLEQLLPVIQQKIASNTVNIGELQGMLHRFDPAMLGPLMEVLQFLQQKSGQNPTDQGTDGDNRRNERDNANGLFSNGMSNSFESNSVRNLNVDTTLHENQDMIYASPTSSALNSPTTQQHATNLSVNGPNSHDLSPTPLTRNAYWQPRYTESAIQSGDESESMQREWRPGLDGRVVTHDGIQSSVYNLHPTSENSAAVADQNRADISSTNSPLKPSDLLPTNVTIKEEPNTSFDDLEDHAVAGGSMVTISGRNRGLGKANEPKFVCQICGDVAAGFHCGAYVCEACKKFYLRCLKSGGSVAYSCPKSKDCPITKETRSHCQFCRYKKCIDLGMYKPGRDDSRHLRVDFKSIPCKVCAAPSSGFHFGAITCEGCKGFFRRMVKEKLHKKFVCMSGGNCDVASSNRTSCKACRYYKCISIGMALQGTRLGRQSNSVKRSTLIEYQKRHGMSVALFPKLGEEAADAAVAKVEQLLQSKAPEIQMKLEPVDDDDFGNPTTPPGNVPSNHDATLSSPVNMTHLQNYSSFDSVGTVHDPEVVSRSRMRRFSISEMHDDCVRPDAYCDDAAVNKSLSDGQEIDIVSTNEPLPVPHSSHSSGKTFAQMDVFPGKGSNHTISSLDQQEKSAATPTSDALDLSQESTISKPVLGWLNLLSGPDAVDNSQDKASAAKRALSLPHEQTEAINDDHIPFKRSKDKTGWSRKNALNTHIPEALAASSLQQTLRDDQWHNGIHQSEAIARRMDDNAVSPDQLRSRDIHSQDDNVSTANSVHSPPIAASHPHMLDTLRDAGLLTSTDVRPGLNVSGSMPKLIPNSMLSPQVIGERMKEFAKHAQNAMAILRGTRASNALSCLSPPLRSADNASISTAALNSPESQMHSPKASHTLNQAGGALEIRERASVGSTLLKHRELFSNEFKWSNMPVDYKLPETPVYKPPERRSTAEKCSEEEVSDLSADEGKHNLNEEQSSNAESGAMRTPDFGWEQLRDTKFMSVKVMDAYKELENLGLPRACLGQANNYKTEKEQAWYAAYESFMHHAKYTLRFVKKIPGFKQLQMEDQVTLVREAVYPITLLFHSQFYNHKADRQRWFCNTDDEREKIWLFFPKFKELNSHIVYSGMLFSELQVTPDEYAFLCALMVFSSDDFMVKDTEKIKKILDSISNAMMGHFAETGRDPSRAGQLILRLSELKRANYEHTQIAMEVQRQNPDMDFSQLWHEMFLAKS